MKTRREKILMVMLVIFASFARAYSAEISHLTVNTMTNPLGIDESPAFGWQISDFNEPISQAGYEIKIFSDLEHSQLICSSGFVATDQSHGVIVPDFIMSPGTRYFWSVEVEDSNGIKTTSQEPAYFDSGLMGDWGNARWIRTGSLLYNDGNLNDYNVHQVIETKIKVVSGNPGVTFSTEAERSCFLWQFILDGEEVTLQRKMSQWSDFIDLGEVAMPGFSKDDFVGKDVTIRLELDGRTNTVVTYVNDTLIDTFKSVSKTIYPEKIGFCDRSVSSGHEIYVDEVSVKYVYSDNGTETILSDDFESGVSHHFLDMDVRQIDGKFKGHISGSQNGYFVTEMNSHRPVFYKEFDVNKEISSARLYTSAIGTYEVYVNGKRVGTAMPDGTTTYEELKPGWTDYRYNVSYFAHDISDLCVRDGNMIGIELNEGYALGDIAHNVYSTNGIFFPSVIAKLVICYSDGSEDIIVTDDTWKLSLHGPRVDADIYRGEYYDARYLYPWEAGYNYRPFRIRLNEVKAKIVPFSGHPVRELQPIKPKTIVIYDDVIDGNDFGKIKIKHNYEGAHSFTLKKGETAIFDFGQNAAGVPIFKVMGNRGVRLKIRAAERLNDSGSSARNNDGPEGSIYRKNYRYDNIGVVYYTLAGDSIPEEHRPCLTYLGYQYCELTASDDVEIVSFESLPFTSSYEKIGEVVTDNQSVNRIFENTLWGQYSNVINIPTDCPSRNERMGWAGDINVFANTALYNANLIETLRVWLRELRNGQREDGAYSDIAPYAINNGAIGHTAWADAGILIPWALYKMTGNVEIVRENYQSMKRFMDYTSTITASGMKYPGTENMYGDWWGFATIDGRFMRQAYYARMAELMAKMAKVLSENDGDLYDADCDNYSALFTDITEEMQSLYFDVEGLKNPSQGACALAVMFNICNGEEQRNAVGKQLADLVANNGNRLNTGFVCTPFVMMALTETGHDDVAYSLLLQRDCPSWLYMIDQGATTFWELWDGYTESNGFHKSRENSFNHFAYGAVVEWMYSHMSGIQSDEELAGFKKIIFKPFHDRRIESRSASPAIKQAKASHRGPQGLISAEWKAEHGDLISYEISVPSNSEAEVLLPMSGEVDNILVNESSAIDSKGVTYIGKKDGRHVFSVLPGNYSFVKSNVSSADFPTQCEVSVYPNPVADYLFIETSEEVRGAWIFDLSGKLVNNWSGEVSRLDLSSLSSGMYILRIETSVGFMVKKVIKK